MIIMVPYKKIKEITAVTGQGLASVDEFVMRAIDKEIEYFVGLDELYEHDQKERDSSSEVHNP